MEKNCEVCGVLATDRKPQKPGRVLPELKTLSVLGHKNTYICEHCFEKLMKGYTDMLVSMAKQSEPMIKVKRGRKPKAKPEVDDGQ